MANTTSYENWLGNREISDDQVTPGHAKGMAAMLDYGDNAPGPGDPLPACWHWMFFMPRARQSTIGADGHPDRGGFMPPFRFPGACLPVQKPPIIMRFSLVMT